MKQNSFENLVVIDHPLLKDKITKMRDVKSSSVYFRTLLQEIAALMTYEVCRNFETKTVRVQTPLENTEAEILKNDITIIPILRAGLGMIDGVISIIPNAKIGMLGLYRNEETLKPVDYYLKFPPGIEEMEVILVDPMLATGGSAIAAAETIKKHGVSNLTMMALIAAPEGVKAMNEAHPDVKIYTAVLDRELNEKGYILPGLGDAGDRIYGT